MDDMYDEFFACLARSHFRRLFRLKEADMAYVTAEGMENIRSYASDFVSKQLVLAFSNNYDRHPPANGHPVFVGLHATATCCRSCLEEWHGIPVDQELTEAQQEYVVNVLMEWIKRQMEKKMRDAIYLEDATMNETVKTLINRKSCRSFTGQHIPAEAMEQIIQAGLNAPSGMNLQTPYLIAVTNDDMVARLSAMNAAVMGADTDPFYGAKDVIAVVAKKECTYIYDGSLAMGNLMNAAFALGIESRWIHRCKEVFASDEGKILLKEWGIEDEVEGIGFCILGYAKEDKPKTVINEGRVVYVK